MSTLVRFPSRLVACFAIASIGWTATAGAQIDQVDRNYGPPMCLHPPTHVPGLSGQPNWWSDAEAANRMRPELDDPRWAGGPRTPYVHAPVSDNIIYRMLLTGSTLSVQILVRSGADEGGPDGSDEVYFGLARENGSDAWVVRLSPVGGTGIVPRVLNVEDNAVFYTCPNPGADGCSTSAEWSPVVFGAPDAIVNARVWNDVEGDGNAATQVSSGGTLVPCGRDFAADTVACNDERHKGFGWGVSFQVDLANIPLSNGDTGDFTGESRPLYTVVTRTVNAGGDAIYYRTPNNQDGCTATSCPVGPGGAPFHPKTAEWKKLSDVGVPCPGQLDMDRLRMGTSDPDLEINEVRTTAGAANRFFANPYEDSATPVFAGDAFRARFRISNWGSVADPRTDWKPVGMNEGVVANPALDPSLPLDGQDPALYLPCTNAGGGRNVCGAVDAFYNTAGDRLHQCLLVELSLSPTAPTDLAIANPAVYRNMYFADLSTLQASAEISVRGLQARLGNSNPRDIYLHVVPRNMPTANASPRADDIAALEAARAQADLGFSKKVGGCERAEDVCIQTGEGGVCVSYCGGAEGDSCTGGRAPFVAEGVCYCVPSVDESEEVYGYETCNVGAPAAGGYNPNRTSLSPSEWLANVYPNFEVFPFYDSGRRVVINGVSRPELVPMPTFSVYAKHSGTFYGYLHGFLADNGTPPVAGSTFEEIRPNYYRLRVPNEGTRRVQINISAEETPHFAPLTQIAGTATTLGLGLGNVQLTGIIGNASSINLRNATIDLTKLLREGNKELVTNLGASMRLTPLPGATPNQATFVSNRFPGLLFQVVDLPIIGTFVQVVGIGASIARPSKCPLFFGTTNLTTAFTFDQGGISLPVSGTDQWSCVPFEIFNL